MKQRADKTIRMHCSYIQITHEQGFDLLDPYNSQKSIDLWTPLPIDLDDDGFPAAIPVPQLALRTVLTEEAFLSVMNEGIATRMKGNACDISLSDGSHAIFSIHFEIVDNLTQQCVQSHIHIVELRSYQTIAVSTAVASRPAFQLDPEVAAAGVSTDLPIMVSATSAPGAGATVGGITTPARGKPTGTLSASSSMAVLPSASASAGFSSSRQIIESLLPTSDISLLILETCMRAALVHDDGLQGSEMSKALSQTISLLTGAPHDRIPYRYSLLTAFLGLDFQRTDTTLVLLSLVSATDQAGAHELCRFAQRCAFPCVSPLARDTALHSVPSNVPHQQALELLWRQQVDATLLACNMEDMCVL
jgi:hypothetical protein